MNVDRREFLRMAASFGAVLALPSSFAGTATKQWRERRDLYPQGVASGDPHADSVLLWTRRPPHADGEAKVLIAEVAEDANFHRVIATAKAPLSSANDWTCRVLAAGLKPRHLYWYRFIDEQGFGSRIGRTITAPSDDDSQPVSFAFVSCQNVQMGPSSAYRRMIWEDERRPTNQQLGFVLHLGDFVYELVFYPEDRPQGYYARRLRDIVRYPHGEKIRDFHVPTTLEDYRILYRGYLLDPDLQDARARWPFVCMWDNHEFSWHGWQSQQYFGSVRPAQTRKVAANQAWFEFQPARVVKTPNSDLNHFDAPDVKDAPIKEFDDHGLGVEPGNLAAIASLKLHRTLRWGRNVELILTDNRSFRSEPVLNRPEAAPFQVDKFPFVVSENVMDILDAGRQFNNGKPPNTIRFNGSDVPNPRKASPPQSMLGTAQKTWFLNRLQSSRATWKLWGNSVGMLDWRVDFQNLPSELGVQWPDEGYALISAEDWSAYRFERNEILRFIKQQRITGVASLAGDRHSFLAGLVSPQLPPKPYDPVIAEFITGSISAPGLFEAAEYLLPKDHPLRAIYLYQPSGQSAVKPAINFSMMHGVRASLALQKSGDIQQALAVRNANVAPELSLADVGGHGYAVVKASEIELEVEFVCIPRPVEKTNRDDGGSLAYRVSHRAKRWTADSAPHLERVIVEGELPLVV